MGRGGWVALSVSSLQAWQTISPFSNVINRLLYTDNRHVLHIFIMVAVSCRFVRWLGGPDEWSSDLASSGRTVLYLWKKFNWLEWLKFKHHLSQSINSRIINNLYLSFRTFNKFDKFKNSIKIYNPTLFLSLKDLKISLNFKIVWLKYSFEHSSFKSF